jgi:CheY-like chemotaxis protein
VRGAGGAAVRLPMPMVAVAPGRAEIAMPNMRGAQLAVMIRALWPDLPIILATGYAELPKGGGLPLSLRRKPYPQQDLAAAIAWASRAEAPSAT